MNISIQDIDSIQYVRSQIVGLLKNLISERDIGIPNTTGMTRANKKLIKHIEKALSSKTIIPEVTIWCKSKIPSLQESNEAFLKLLDEVAAIKDLTKSEKAYVREVCRLYTETYILLLDHKG